MCRSVLWWCYCIIKRADCSSSAIPTRLDTCSYFHCSMHCLNLSASKDISIAAIRHAQDVVRVTITCFHSSAKRSSFLTSCIAEADIIILNDAHLGETVDDIYKEQYSDSHNYKRSTNQHSEYSRIYPAHTTNYKWPAVLTTSSYHRTVL